MLAKIDINKLPSGGIEVAVLVGSRGSIRSYPSLDEVKKALLSLGIPLATIEDQLRLLSGIRPRELLYFATLEVDDDTLHANGFLPQNSGTAWGGGAKEHIGLSFSPEDAGANPARSTSCAPSTGNQADYTITEGQPLDVPWVHPELCSRAGYFESPEIGL